jgi:hypothetical protein
VGIRDVILPDDIKDLRNKVTEARKAAEAKQDRPPRPTFFSDAVFGVVAAFLADDRGRLVAEVEAVEL